MQYAVQPSPTSTEASTSLAGLYDVLENVTNSSIPWEKKMPKIQLIPPVLPEKCRFAFKHEFYNFKMSTVTKVLLALVVDGCHGGPLDRRKLHRTQLNCKVCETRPLKGECVPRTTLLIRGDILFVNNGMRWWHWIDPEAIAVNCLHSSLTQNPCVLRAFVSSIEYISYMILRARSQCAINI